EADLVIGVGNPELPAFVAHESERGRMHSRARVRGVKIAQVHEQPARRELAHAVTAKPENDIGRHSRLPDPDRLLVAFVIVDIELEAGVGIFELKSIDGCLPRGAWRGIRGVRVDDERAGPGRRGTEGQQEKTTHKARKHVGLPAPFARRCERPHFTWRSRFNTIQCSCLDRGLRAMTRRTGPDAMGSNAIVPLHAGDSDGLFPHDAFDRAALALAEQSAGVGVWSIDLTTNRVRGTAQFFRIMGLPPTSDSIPVDARRALRHPADRGRVVEGFRAALDAGGDSYEIEYRIIRPDGNQRWIFGRGRVIRDHDGIPLRYNGVDLDITDRKATEEALTAARQELERMNQVLEQRVRERTAELEAEAARRVEAEARLNQAQKMEAVGQLTGGIAHDFNNILQVIMGSLEIIAITLNRAAVDENNSESHALAERVTATAQRAARSAQRLIERLLAFSRRQPLAPTAIDADALIGEMKELIDRAVGDTIVFETLLAADGALVYVDRSQLESVLLNLVVNSRDAMPDGGRLLVNTATVDYRASCPADLTPGQYAVLTVPDTGCAIASDKWHRRAVPS